MRCAPPALVLDTIPILVLNEAGGGGGGSGGGAAHSEVCHERRCQTLLLWSSLSSAQLWND